MFPEFIYMVNFKSNEVPYRGTWYFRSKSELRIFLKLNPDKVYDIKDISDLETGDILDISEFLYEKGE